MSEVQLEVVERRKYLELNNLREEELTDQDLENIEFNVMYVEESSSRPLCRGMNRRDVDSFAYGVLNDMGLNGWRVDWSKASPGLCIHDAWPSKDSGAILLPIKYLATQPLWYALEYVLHEVAHIDTFTGNGDGHTPEFFSEYAKLVDKYLGKGE